MTFDPRVDPGYPGDAQTTLFGRDPLEGAGEATGDGEAGKDLAPVPDGEVQATEALPDLAWSHLDHDGHPWRHRLHPDRLRERPGGRDADEREHAPGTYAWELEKRVDGEWRPVRYCNRRDEIWNHIRENPGGAGLT